MHSARLKVALKAVMSVRWSVRPLVRLSVGLSIRPQGVSFLFYSLTNNRCDTRTGVRVNIDDGYNLLKGQGHRVKGQGLICYCVDTLFN